MSRTLAYGPTISNSEASKLLSYDGREGEGVRPSCGEDGDWGDELNKADFARPLTAGCGGALRYISGTRGLGGIDSMFGFGLDCAEPRTTDCAASNMLGRRLRFGPPSCACSGLVRADSGAGAAPPAMLDFHDLRIDLRALSFSAVRGGEAGVGTGDVDAEDWRQSNELRLSKPWPGLGVMGTDGDTGSPLHWPAAVAVGGTEIDALLLFRQNFEIPFTLAFAPFPFFTMSSGIESAEKRLEGVADTRPLSYPGGGDLVVKGLDRPHVASENAEWRSSRAWRPLGTGGGGDE